MWTIRWRASKLGDGSVEREGEGLGGEREGEELGGEAGGRTSLSAKREASFRGSGEGDKSVIEGSVT